MDRYDIAVIGAGVTGCAIARALSRYDWSVVVLDKNREVGEGATKANSAIVHGGYDPKPGTLKARLNAVGARMIRELSGPLDFPYRSIGSLVLAFTDEEEAILGELLDRGHQNGVGGLSLLTRQAVLTLEPAVSPLVQAALLCTEAGIVCPFGLTYALIENALANGVELRRDCTVLGLRREEDGYLITTDGAELHARLVINAAGIHADEIAALLGEADYSICPRKGEYRVLHKSEGQRVGHVIFQTPSPLGKGIIVAPTVYGNLLVGPNSLEASDNDSLIPTPAGLALVDKGARRSVPDLRLEQTIRTFSGLRASSTSGDFEIRHSPKNPGFFQAAGIDSPGLTASPAIAEYLLELILKSGLVQARKKTGIIETRRSIRPLPVRGPAEKTAAASLDPGFDTIVCRCEGVSRAQIQEAIRRPPGAVTIDGVKRRVRAGMGPCQGAYCRPRVRQLIAEELGIPAEDVQQSSRRP